MSYLDVSLDLFDFLGHVSHGLGQLLNFFGIVILLLTDPSNQEFCKALTFTLTLSVLHTVDLLTLQDPGAVRQFTRQ